MNAALNTAAEGPTWARYAATGQKLWRALQRGSLKWLQGLNGRERGAIVAMLLAVLAGLELLWVAPMHDKRVAIEQAAQQQAQADTEAEQARLAQQRQDAAALQARMLAVDEALTQHGSARAPQTHQSLGAWLDQALTGQAVRLVALRDLEPETVSLDPLPAAAGAPDALAPTLAAGALATAGLGPTPGAPLAPLHRLRFELQLSGEPAALAQATQTLAERMAPLRLARVHLARTEAGTVQATLLFVILAPAREWIRL